MFDFHAHLLPGIDDGPKSWEESMSMARRAVANGVTKMVLTPHYDSHLYKNNTVENILNKFTEFKECLRDNGIPLQIYPGAECFLSLDLPRLLKEGYPLTINNGGKYLLVELPKLDIPVYTYQVLFEILLNGVVPVLAHPERNLTIMENPGILTDLAQRGVLFQVTTGSISGGYGRRAQKTARKWLKTGMVHFIGTDTHSADDDLSGLSEVKRAISKLAGKENADRLIMTNGEFVVEGKKINERERD